MLYIYKKRRDMNKKKREKYIVEGKRSCDAEMTGIYDSFAAVELGCVTVGMGENVQQRGAVIHRPGTIKQASRMSDGDRKRGSL